MEGLEKMMNEWLKTECGEFKKSSIKGVRLNSVRIPICYPKGLFSMVTSVSEYWKVQILIDGVWITATNSTENKREIQNRLNSIIRTLKEDES